jgi:hypothetical protein
MGSEKKDCAASAAKLPRPATVKTVKAQRRDTLVELGAKTR